MKRKHDTKESNNRIPVNRVPHGNLWRRNSQYKDSEETQISNISEVSKYDDEKNSAIDEIDIHFEGKKDENGNQYTNGDEDDNGGCLF